MKVEVAVLDSPSLIIHMVSVHVKQHLKKNEGIDTCKRRMSAGLICIQRTSFDSN